MMRQQLARLLAVGALGAVVIAVVLVLITSGSTYVVHAQFADAGQLVGGDLVTVAGHQVGSVGPIKLSPNGLADVELDISDDSITPIHSGSIASIGQLSLTGVANRFVGLSLSGAGPAIKNGGTLPSSQTRGIVDLDVFLDSLTPRVRSSLQQLFRSGAYVVGQPTASQINQSLGYFSPALSQTTQLGSEVLADKFALDRLIASTAQVASALAPRSSDLQGAVTNTAAALREVASERTALQDALARAPGVLGQSTGVLANVDRTLRTLNPALADLQPVAPRLARLLRQVVPTASDANATLAGVQGIVPSAERALRDLPPAESKAEPAVRSLTAALTAITPILAGLRPYTPDVVAGFFSGVGGSNGGYYDANGHYLRSLLTLYPNGSDSLKGLLALVGNPSSVGPFTSGRNGLLAACPGGGNPPAADASNPWNFPDVLPGTGRICNPADNQTP